MTSRIWDMIDEAGRSVAVLLLSAQREHEDFVRIVLADSLWGFLASGPCGTPEKVPTQSQKIAVHSESASAAL